MSRAVGGPAHFASQSPTVILGNALREEGRRPHEAADGFGVGGAPLFPLMLTQRQQSSSFYRSFVLRGEAVARRAGFDRPRRGAAPRAPANFAIIQWPAIRRVPPTASWRCALRRRRPPAALRVDERLRRRYHCPLVRERRVLLGAAGLAGRRPST
jgi:hypothetical protein